MLITFSIPSVSPSHVSGPLAQAQVIDHNICAEITWKRPNQARLTLRHLGTQTPASTKATEAFIAAVLACDPHATIKTARAIYRNRADYEKQRGLTRTKA